MTDYMRLSLAVKLSEEFIDKEADKLDWQCISSCQKLSEKMIIKHIDKVNWIGISIYQELSEPFIKKYINYLNFDNIQSHQKLSETFINEHKNMIDLSIICARQNISEKFIIDNLKGINQNNLWQTIAENQQLSESFIIEYFTNFKQCLDEVFINQKLSSEFISMIINGVNGVNKVNRVNEVKNEANVTNDLNWSIILKYQKLTIQQILQNIDKFIMIPKCAKRLIKYQNISPEIAKKIIKYRKIGKFKTRLGIDICNTIHLDFVIINTLIDIKEKYNDLSIKFTE